MHIWQQHQQQQLLQLLLLLLLLMRIPAAVFPSPSARAPPHLQVMAKCVRARQNPVPGVHAASVGN